jgi:hypothetical protein
VKNVRRVIDNTLLFADYLEKAFHHVAEYLTLVGNNGIILNPDKFSFREDVVGSGCRRTRLSQSLTMYRQSETSLHLRTSQTCKVFGHW